MKRTVLKIACIIVSACMATGLFTGCGARENAALAKPSKGASASYRSAGDSPYEVRTPVKLQIFHYMGEQFKRDGLEDLTKGITAKNPNITFEISAIAYAQYGALLQTKVASGDIPDILTGRPQNQRELVNAGVFMELTDKPFIKKIQEEALLEQKVDNKVWSVPIDYTAFGVMYNRKMFRQYNLKEPATLTEMVDICETFRKNGIVPFIHPYKDTNQPGVEFNSFFNAMAYQFDRSIYTDLQFKKRKWSETDLARKGLQIFEKYLLYTDPGDIATDPTQAINIFASEKRPMFIGGLWTAGDIRKTNANGDFGFFAPPWSDNPRENVLTFSVDDSFEASASSKNPNAVLFSLDFIAGDEGTKIWSKSTNLMCTSTGDAGKSSTTEPVILAAYDYFNKGLAAYRKDVPAFSGEASAKFRTMMQWLASLKPSERNIDKTLNYFDKEFSTLQ